ncbi:Glycerol-3-phosphate/dihydroxyacetone phosphate acyltransferase [Dispira simplex]|nr:Glycerol-3-phosphate/dihydroxyacetone phosphate acyltransferase [Dispira simplex]
MTHVPRWLSNLCYDITVWFFSQVIGIFFREIGERNAHVIPDKGPLFFVTAPHHNQFVDPLVLFKHCRRRVSLLAAEVTMKRPLVGLLARLVGCVAVARAQDCDRKGTGVLHLTDRYHNPTLLTGTETKFKEEVHPGDSVALPSGNAVAAVAAVLSDTELRLKREFKSLEALEALTSPEGTSFKIRPHLDQSHVYNEVHKAMAEGRCVGIFPEGGSHDRAQMLPLKAGVAVMTLGAMAENPDLNVRIVPCGLNYFHPHKFRSRAIIQFGDPLEIDPKLVAKFKEGGVHKREACAALLDQISEALQSVTINTPDYETLQLIQAGRRLYRPNGRRLSMAQVVELTRRFVKGYMIFKDNPAVQEIRERLAVYNQDLIYYGLRDHQVPRMTLNRADALVLLGWRLAWFCIMAMLALPGVVLNGPIFIAAKLISKKKAKEALAKSSVKIEGRDVLATWKILVCLVLFPALYIFYAVMAVYWRVTQPHWFTGSSLHTLQWVGNHHPIYAAWLTLVCLPMLSYACLWFGESGLVIYRSIRPLFLVLLLGANSIRQLARRREALSEDITDLINELAPKIYPNFDQEKAKLEDDEDDGKVPLSQRQRRRIYQGLHADEIGDEEEATSSRFKFPSLTPTTMSRLNWVSPLEFLGTYADNTPTTPGELTRHVGEFFGVSDWQWDKVDAKDSEDDVFLFRDPHTNEIVGRPSGHSRISPRLVPHKQLHRSASQSFLGGKKPLYAGSPGTTGGLTALTRLNQEATGTQDSTNTEGTPSSESNKKANGDDPSCSSKES